MRPIKFRVWNITDKYWVNPNILEVWDDSGTLEPFKYIKTGTLNPLYTPIENYVIQQYIGIKDNNGKEIYEGDYIQGQDYEFPVEVINEYGAFGLKYSNRNLYFCELESAKQIQMTVVGNIFEKPKLLKV